MIIQRYGEGYSIFYSNKQRSMAFVKWTYLKYINNRWFLYAILIWWINDITLIFDGEILIVWCKKKAGLSRYFIWLEILFVICKINQFVWIILNDMNIGILTRIYSMRYSNFNCNSNLMPLWSNNWHRNLSMNCIL